MSFYKSLLLLSLLPLRAASSGGLSKVIANITGPDGLSKGTDIKTCLDQLLDDYCSGHPDSTAADHRMCTTEPSFSNKESAEPPTLVYKTLSFGERRLSSNETTNAVADAFSGSVSWHTLNGHTAPSSARTSARASANCTTLGLLDDTSPGSPVSRESITPCSTTTFKTPSSTPLAVRDTGSTGLPTPDNNSSSDYLLKKSNQIALGVGLGLGLPTIVGSGLWWAWRRYKARSEVNSDEEGHTGGGNNQQNGGTGNTHDNVNITLSVLPPAN